MGFIVTPPTAVPVNPDASQDQLTWGEAGAPPSVPPKESPGYGPEILPSNDVNYEWQQAGRWSRSTVNRTVLSDEGFLSTCVLDQGAWNIGGGTLDVTLGVTRVVVDADDNGGVALEIKATLASPETIAANSDVYVNLNEAGAVELQTVPNDDPPPVPTAGYVAIWVLVTDATELTAVNMADGIAPFPCFGPLVGARAMLIEVPTLGAKAADLVTVTGTMVVAEEAIFSLGVVGPAGAIDLPEGGTIAAGKGIAGDNTTSVTTGAVNGTSFQGLASTAAPLTQGATVSATKYVLYGISTPPTLQGQTGFDAAGEALHYNGDHVRAPGARASGRQEALTGAAQVTTICQTDNRQTAPVSLDITVAVYIQRSVAGSVTLTIEEDNGVDGGGQVWSTLGNAFVTPALGATHQLMQFTRVRILDSVNRYYRLKADSGGGTTQVMKEAHLSVRPIS